MRRIAVIGLGTMGAPMAENLLKAGHSVTVHNRTRSREEALSKLGCQRAPHPKAAVEGAEVILICVSDTPDVEDVVFTPDTGAFSGLEPDQIIVDCSTISPVKTREFAERVAARGARWIDAPVSGGSEGAKAGTLAVMCGGDPQDLARVRPVLDAIGRRITHVGPVGSGQIAKAVNQVVISGIYQAVAEGITLARKAGADPRRVVEAIGGGAAASWVLEHRASNMIEDCYPLGFRLRLHRKDLGIALETARAVGACMPVASWVATTEDGLISQGHGDEDLSALARAVRRSASLPDGPLAGD